MNLMIERKNESNDEAREVIKRDKGETARCVEQNARLQHEVQFKSWWGRHGDFEQ